MGRVMAGHFDNISIDAVVTAWADQVVVNGGEYPSLDRRVILSQFVTSLKASGAYDKLDDFSVRAGNSTAEALTSIKQLRLASVIGTPVFAPNRGYTYNATSSALNTGFIPGTHAVVMAGDDLHIGMYLRTDTTNVPGSVAFGARNSVSQNLTLRPRGAGNVIVGALNNTAATYATNAVVRHLTSIERYGATPTLKAYVNGDLINTPVVASTSTSLVTFAVYEGAMNGGGTAANFYAGQCAFSYVGAAFRSDAMHASFWAAVQTCLTSIEAGV